MAVGNESTPVYIDDDGIARECTAVTPSGTTASIKRFQSTADATGQYTWFEVWPDGWVKQGGCVRIASGNGNTTTITFPIEFRDMLYQPHMSATDMAAGYSEPATPVGTGVEQAVGRMTTSTMCLQLEQGYTTGQMIFWTAEGYRNPLKDIPTGYTETAISLTGVSSTGGGVIDGTLWEDPTIVAVTSTGAKEITYAVKHNCYLGINMRQLLNPNDTSICAYVNGVLVWKIGEMEAGTESSDDLCHGIPVKAGSSIKVTFSVSTLHTGASVVFSEFKLHALDPQIAMPDYNRMTDKTADIEATGGWIATEAGYIVTNAISQTNTGAPNTVYLTVNGKIVFQAYHYTGASTAEAVPYDVIPVSKGDVISAPQGHKLAGETYTYSFAPCKANIIEISSENGGCGVVDGTLLSQTTKTSTFCELDGTVSTYTVKNDCWLYMKWIATGSKDLVHYNALTVDDKVVIANECNEGETCAPMGVPVKKGSIVKIKALKVADDSPATYAGTSLSETWTFVFREYALKAANIKVDTQVGMPDWDSSKKVQIETGDVIGVKPGTCDGYIVYSTQAGSLKINGVDVMVESAQYHDGMYVVPVSVNDVVTFAAGEDCRFYPAKAVPAKLSELTMGTPDWSNAERLAMTANVELVMSRDGFVNAGAGNNCTFWVNGVMIAYDGNSTGCDTNLVPVSVGDKLKCSMTFSKTDDDAYAWFIPRKKVQIDVSDITAVGGGVIDGTQFTDTYKLVPYTTWTDNTKKNSDGEWEYKYEVQNDCLFYANFLVHANAGATDLVTIKLNDVIFDYYSENQGNASAVGTYFQTLQLPLKKGTVVKFCSKSKPNHNQVFNITDAKIEAFAIKHAEYKLTAIAPQVAFPDWDTNKKENVTVFPYTVSKNGYLYICVANVGSEAYVYVNGQEVHYACTASYGDSCGVVPVSKGDVVTVGGSFASAAVHSVTFYPAKVIQQEGSSSSGGFVGMDLARATAVALPYQATEDGWFNVEMNSTSTSGYIQLSEDGTNWVNIICTRSSDTHIVPMCKGQWVRGSSLNIRSGGIGPQFIPAKKSS